MVCFTYAPFFQQIVTHIAEDHKLLSTIQSVNICTFCDHIKDHFLGVNHFAENWKCHDDKKVRGGPASGDTIT